MKAKKTKTTARPRLNAEWHNAHRMPKNPTWEERITWHVAHAAHCACRQMPANIQAEIIRRQNIE